MQSRGVSFEFSTKKIIQRFDAEVDRYHYKSIVDRMGANTSGVEALRGNLVVLQRNFSTVSGLLTDMLDSLGSFDIEGRYSSVVAAHIEALNAVAVATIKTLPPIANLIGIDAARGAGKAFRLPG